MVIGQFVTDQVYCCPKFLFLFNYTCSNHMCKQRLQRHCNFLYMSLTLAEFFKESEAFMEFEYVFVGDYIIPSGQPHDHCKQCI